MAEGDESLSRSLVRCMGSTSNACGYCRGQFSSRSYGVWAYQLSVRDYQHMLDAGWRRSGNFLYRPDLVSSCCPAYTIRLEADTFVPTSSQKRILKRLRQHLAPKTQTVPPVSNEQTASSTPSIASASTSAQQSTRTTSTVGEADLQSAQLEHEGEPLVTLSANNVCSLSKPPEGSAELRSTPQSLVQKITTSSPSTHRDEVHFPNAPVSAHENRTIEQTQVRSQQPTTSIPLSRTDLHVDARSAQSSSSRNTVPDRVCTSEPHPEKRLLSQTSGDAHESDVKEEVKYSRVQISTPLTDLQQARHAATNHTTATPCAGTERSQESYLDRSTLSAGGHSPKRKAVSESSTVSLRPDLIDSYKHRVLSAIRQTILDVSGSYGLQDGFVDPATVQSALEKVGVNAPRRRSAKKLRKRKAKGRPLLGSGRDDCTTQCHQDGAEPHFSTNAALVLAAAERRSRSMRPSVSNHEQRAIAAPMDRPAEAEKLKPACTENGDRQVQLGQMLMSRLTSVYCGSDRLIRRVELAEPGFINMWVSCDDAESLSSRPLVNTGSPSHSRPNSLQHARSRKAQTRASPSMSGKASGNRKGRTGASAKIPVVQGAEGNFTMELVPSHFDWEAFAIYQRYQTTIHHEELSVCGKDSYIRFLVDSPLIMARDAEYPEQGCGSFHMLYKINGRLFAVGVVDVLPLCLSSVYLFYDPDFAMLSPGVLSALKEIEWVQSVRPQSPSLRYYYMGYYIHTCKKMSYKANYGPSEMLCPETRTWVPTKLAVEALERGGGRASRLALPGTEPAADVVDFDLTNAEASAEANNALIQVDRNRDVPLYHLRRILNREITEVLQRVQNLITTFVLLVGRKQSKCFTHKIPRA